MKIIVFGASGRTGQEVVRQALEQGQAVTAFVRSPQKLNIDLPGRGDAKLRYMQGDALDREAVSRAIEGHDSVVSCLGTKGFSRGESLSEMTANLIAGMQKHDVGRISYVASAGIYKEIPGVTGFLVQLLLRQVLANHRKAADALEASGLQWTIVRPLQLVNGRLRGEYLEARHGVPSGKGRISRADVAHFLLRTLKDMTYVNQSVALSY
ncbi:NAD(P)-dependent oxidoreductase [Paenibacillus sp. CF384]|uniref:NAD(P)-dependent oxidoreductase n=1 Tax=Paenibacillus sp. CF384 TaxID=1884382 RepID=UPI000897F03A|nr:NAD(P)-binding oxidoreductase [Paenibacillus sp. CF384]SDW68510.1 Putative NADH-flavin reductase [Paenibacillus sp. CF384]